MSMTLSRKSDKHRLRAALSSLGHRSVRDMELKVMEQRAFEAVIWGMPAVNFDLMYRAMEKAGGKWNQIVYWSRLFDWKNQTLTPNPDVIYLLPFFNTKDAGPMVLEIPPAEGGSLTGSIDDGWQTALEDVGPAGADKGKGGKYLILPPGYKEAPPEGYIVLSCNTYRSYALLRSNSESSSDADIARAVNYGKRVKVYPLKQAANPAPTVFVDAINTVYDSTIPYDASFFEALDRFVQHEPWLPRDRMMIDFLKSIGIEKGKTFVEPDGEIQLALELSASSARTWLESRYEAVFSPPFNEGTHWALPASPALAEGLQTDFANPDQYPVDDRGMTYSMAFFSPKHLGAGQFYLMTIKDKLGQSLDGDRTYRLTVPANAPVRLYWSATAYDRATHALIRDTPYSSRSSKSPGLRQNTDGSTDLYFGPKAPAGQAANWVPTAARGTFEVLFRFYGPDKPLFEKKWVLPDIERSK